MLVAHPDVPCLSFTGSTPAGRAIGEAAATVGAWSSFLQQGQICMTAGRHLAHRSLVDDYTRLLAEKADKIPAGDPADPATVVGPLIDERQRDRVHEIVEASAAAGCHRAGWRQIRRPSTGRRCSPTYRSTRRRGEQRSSARWHRSSPSVSLLTSDAFAAVELADRIHAGAVNVNDSTVDDEAVAPFGGLKASGTGGRFGGAAANLETFCETQWVRVQSRVEPYPF